MSVELDPKQSRGEFWLIQIVKAAYELGAGSRPCECDSNLPLEGLVEKSITERDVKELALGFLRYEALRRLNPRQFAELHARNLKGEMFDDMVTEELLKWKGQKL